MTVSVNDPGTPIVCGNHFDGQADILGGRIEILVRDGRIAEMPRSAGHPPAVRVVDLSGHTVMPGFTDCHVHPTMDASRLASQLLDSTATKALVGPSLQ